MKTPFLLAGAMAVGLLSSGLASAKTCRDAQGHYVKCPAATSTTTTAKTTTKTAKTSKAAPAPSAGKAPKAAPAPSAAKSERCRDASGHFVKCGATTSATPAAPAPAAAKKPSTLGGLLSGYGRKAPTQAAGTPPASSAAQGVTTSPAGATARCKDGSYSHSQTRSGTCSRHGGVAEWMK